MKNLFITRKFPPTKGGMEKVAYELYIHLSKITEVELIKWGGANKWLFFILPYFLFKSIWILLTKKIDIVYLQDGLLAPLGLVLKIFRKPVAITIHGLDITYKNRFYQFLIPNCLKKLDKIICISNSTKQECLKRGIPEGKVTVIPDGISDEFYIAWDKKTIRNQLERRFNISLEDKKIILSVGRLVERKGFHWFVTEVIPKLIQQRKDFIYIIGGEGFFRKKIEVLIQNKLQDFVKILGQVENEDLKMLYNAADTFVMPNIRVKGDMEGFGIVALEAASCGLPVIASNLEGIKDAVKNNQNGFLVEPYDSEGFIKTICQLLENDEIRESVGKKAREFTLENYSWDKVTQQYLNEFEISIKKRQ